MTDRPLRLVGAPGSPYSRKVRSALRFRRIPYEWAVRGSEDDVGTPQPPVSLIPIVVLPEAPDTALVDSTPILRRLEERNTGRSIVPPDPVLAFLDELIEDFADEWVTKMMFHYRWYYDADIEKAGLILPLWRMPKAHGEQHQQVAEAVRRRQIDRLWVVGSNDVTAPVIEASYRRLLQLLDQHLTRHRFLFGERPSTSDFGLFGQLTQLVQFDPTPLQVAQEVAPRIWAWIELIEDLSGHRAEPDQWLDRNEAGAALRPLLEEIGRVYAPFLLANATALEQGQDEFETEIDGKRWHQRSFPYQLKCLRWLRQSYLRLSADSQRAVDDLLTGSGCDALFADI